MRWFFLNLFFIILLSAIVSAASSVVYDPGAKSWVSDMSLINPYSTANITSEYVLAACNASVNIGQLKWFHYNLTTLVSGPNLINETASCASAYKHQLLSTAAISQTEVAIAWNLNGASTKDTLQATIVDISAETSTTFMLAENPDISDTNFPVSIKAIEDGKFGVAYINGSLDLRFLIANRTEVISSSTIMGGLGQSIGLALEAYNSTHWVLTFADYNKSSINVSLINSSGAVASSCTLAGIVTSAGDRIAITSSKINSTSMIAGFTNGTYHTQYVIYDAACNINKKDTPLKTLGGGTDVGTVPAAYYNSSLFLTGYHDNDEESGYTNTFMVLGYDGTLKTSINFSSIYRLNGIRAKSISRGYSLPGQMVLVYDTSTVYAYRINGSAWDDTPITLASAIITPSNPDTSTDLTCNNGSVSDMDGDIISFAYSWFLNSTQIAPTGLVLGKGNFSAGDKIYCKINATDQFSWTGAVTSQTVIIDSVSIAPVINSTNATTQGTLILSVAASPTNNNTLVNLSVYYSDTASDKQTAYFCRSNVFDGSCAGGMFCKSDTNSTLNPLTCTYDPSAETAQSVSYWVYVIDNSSLYQGSGSGTQGAFYVNHPPVSPSLSSPGNYSWVNLNWTLLQYSASDPDGNALNYTIYVSSDDVTYTELGLVSAASLNFSGLNETTYWWKVMANDSFGHASDVSEAFSFRVDTVGPVLENASYTGNILTDEKEYFWMDCADDNSGANATGAYWNLTDIYGTYGSGSFVSAGGDRFNYTYTPLGTAGTYTIDSFWCYDLAGNARSYLVNDTFITSVRSSDSPGGGGGLSIVIANISNVSLAANVKQIDIYFLILPPILDYKYRAYEFSVNKALASCVSDNPDASCTANVSKVRARMMFDPGNDAQLMSTKEAELTLTGQSGEILHIPFRVRALNLAAYAPSSMFSWLKEPFTSSYLFQLDQNGTVVGIRYLAFAILAGIIALAIYILANIARFL